MAIYRVQRLFADQAQISDLQKKISEAQAAGKDTSSLQRMLTRAQGDIAKETANAGRTMVAGQGIGATAIADTSNAKTAATNIENAAKTVQNSSAQQSFIKGQNSVGLKQGALNTWNKMGKMGKAGVIGAGLLGTGLMAKGLLGGGSKEAAFSEDTGAALQEAAIYGTLGTGILGAGYLAKKGMLGKTGKKTYESASKKVKAIWNESKKPDFKKEEQVVSKAVEKGGKSGTTATTEKITKESGKPDKITVETTAKKVKFTPEDWPKVRKVMVENGMNINSPADKLAAAKIAGVKPVSVK